jgi:hypothetical protein
MRKYEKERGRNGEREGEENGERASQRWKEREAQTVGLSKSLANSA